MRADGFHRMGTFSLLTAEDEFHRDSALAKRKAQERERRLEKVKTELASLKDKAWADMDDSDVGAEGSSSESDHCSEEIELEPEQVSVGIAAAPAQAKSKSRKARGKPQQPENDLDLLDLYSFKTAPSAQRKAAKPEPVVSNKKHLVKQKLSALRRASQQENAQKSAKTKAQMREERRMYDRMPTC